MKRQTLTDADISTRRNITRRSLLRSLGTGAAAVAAVAGIHAAAQAQPKPKPADPCRDRDHGPSDQDGCPTA